MKSLPLLEKRSLRDFVGVLNNSDEELSDDSNSKLEVTILMKCMEDELVSKENSSSVDSTDNLKKKISEISRLSEIYALLKRI